MGSYTIPSRDKYALKIMFEIAYSGLSGEPVTVKDICEKQEIPTKFAEQIIRLLKKDNLIISTRGISGGYNLSRPAKDITMCQILDATSGVFQPVACTPNSNDCPKYASCPTAIVWQRYYEAATSAIDNLTLQFLIDEFEKKQKEYGSVED